MKKVGAITIGQAPRTDILSDVEAILGGELELVQAGALDGMTPAEVEALRPDGTGNTLVSRLRDGTAVQLEERKLLPLLQERITRLERQGVSAILLMCTGEFPETFSSGVPLIFPSRVICAIVSALGNVRRIGVITPDREQFEDITGKWSRIVPHVIPVEWNPYLEERSESAAAALREADIDLAVMDCFGYSERMRQYAASAIGRPVILSRTLAVRVLREIV